MRKILIADDERKDVKELIEMLRQRGHEVEYVVDGRAALERASSEKFDAAIFDWNMRPSGMYSPESDKYLGDSVAAEVRRMDPYMPIILRSSVSYAFEKQMENIRVECFNKSVEPEKVVKHLEEIFSTLM